MGEADALRKSGGALPIAGTLFVRGNTGILVSTIFTVINYAALFGDYDAPPILWETMIIGGPDDQWQRRYTSLEAALAEHAQLAERQLRRGATYIGTLCPPRQHAAQPP